MKAITLSRTLNIVLLVLLAVAAITTKTAYAACKTDSGGGSLCGSAWLAVNTTPNVHAHDALGNAGRNPAPYLTTIYVEGWTSCGTYHRISSAQNQIQNSTATISARALSGPLAGACPDSQYHYNESKAWSHAHNSAGQLLGTVTSTANSGTLRNW